MKTDIKQVTNIYVSNPEKWWTWNAFCDKCGEQFRSPNIYSSSKPDENEKDYCLDCMREMIDNKIYYETRN